jgi:N-acetyl-anhydromuramyl-L-alanine amidase AmpD
MITAKKTLTLSALGLVAAAQASTDYGPAIWKPLCKANYYTSGYGHKFFVVHDMEGYYAYTCSWFTGCSAPSASVHFATNGKKDATSDAAAGEISQLGVRTAQYAWHATCWNQHSLGTEHEGFASNPAWYTDVQYETSAACTRAMANQFGFAKDRNHIVGHGEKSRSSWVTWANANLGINATCNTHTDPGPYWDWTKYMNMINGGVGKTAVIKDNTAATYTGTWATGSSATDKYGADYRYHSTAPISEPAQWLATLNTSASWNVRAWWPQGANRSATAGYIVTHGAGTTTVSKNQQANGGSWQLLGTWSMGTGKVQLSCWTTSGFIVVADAIKWD